MPTEPTLLGKIGDVNGSNISVELEPSIPSGLVFVDGAGYRIGQLGSFVRIPIGLTDLYGIINQIGASAIPEKLVKSGQDSRKWMTVQLIGEKTRGCDFERGLSQYPTTGDPVHLVTLEDLVKLYGKSDSSAYLNIGSVASGQSIPALVNIDKIVTRHAAIVGSTGSGKSNTVACLLNRILKADYNSSSVVVIDPHGEYRATFEGVAKVFSINDPINKLILPFWALSYDELAWFLFDRKTSAESQQDITIRDRIYEEKAKSVNYLKSGPIKETDITADSPIPFDLKKLWYEFYTTENATLTVKDDWDKIAFKKDNSGNEIKGDACAIIPPEFEPPGTGSSPPFKSTKGKGLQSYLSKLFGRLRDLRYSFLLNPDEYDGTKKDLGDLLDTWLNHNSCITIFDLGGVPSEILDLVVGVLARILFQNQLWGRNLKGIGRQRPILMFLEEAHLYLPRGGSEKFISGYASATLRKVFKEGRKYGIGAVVISQRPSDLDETILSQCGTIFALRLTNSDDQGRVRAMLPDSWSGITELIPALRTGEAIIVGEGVKIPSRIRLPLIEPRPSSNDPIPSKEWSSKLVPPPNYNLAVTGWRTQTTKNDKE